MKELCDLRIVDKVSLSLLTSYRFKMKTERVDMKNVFFKQKKLAKSYNRPDENRGNWFGKIPFLHSVPVNENMAIPEALRRIGN